jgi:hypothetical protein
METPCTEEACSTSWRGGAGGCPRLGAEPADYPNGRCASSWPSRPAAPPTSWRARSRQKLSERFKQNFLIDNKPGGGGNIGTEMAARAAPDGYTLIVNSVGPMAVNPRCTRS